MKRVFSLTLLSTPLQYTPKTAAGLHYTFLAIAFSYMGPLNISFSPAHYIFLEITFPPGHSYTGSSEKKRQAFLLKEQ
jgi:hypothetical protein